MSDVPSLVVIPAHNEEQSIGATLSSLKTAIDLCGEEVFVVIVCDDCTDKTAEIAIGCLKNYSSLVVEARYRSVGEARNHGVKVGLEHFPQARWIAFTDADTLLEGHWLRRQIETTRLGYDAYFGRVSFDESTDILKRFAEAYRVQTHARVHGANMGLSLNSYVKVGGVPKLSAHEDKVLSELLTQAECKLFWDNEASVLTSVRTEGRAPEGFAFTLNRFTLANVLAS